MNIAAPAAATIPAPVAAASAAAPDPARGWAPASLVVVPSRFGDSIRGSIWGTWRGVRELQDGQALTSVMLDRLTPLMASAYGLGESATRDALSAVRLYVGGPVRGFGMAASVLSNRVYALDERMLGYITSFGGRRLLIHELGHVLQRERINPSWARVLGEGELGRDRASLLNYVAATPSAATRGTLGWLAERLPGRTGDRHRLADLVHDAHRLEAEAEAKARTISDQLS